jgi:hypothetical protein
VTGAATALAAALGVFCVGNAALAHEWRVCRSMFGCNYSGPGVSLLPTTSVTLPDGSPLTFGLYAVVILACGLFVAVAALQLSIHPRPAWRIALCAASLLLALSLVVFRLPAPSHLVEPVCAPFTCHSQIVSYPDAIPSVVYLVPAAVLGLLAAVLGMRPSLLPASVSAT